MFDLCNECGTAGYYVFFGVLEMYSREFKSENAFSLSVSWRYLVTKLSATRPYVIKKALQFCSDRKRFDVKFNGKNIEIFIPKFKKYLDETTLKKLRMAERKSGVVPESIRNQSGQAPESLLKSSTTEADIDIDNTPHTPQGGKPEYSKSFETWWSLYPSKKGKDAAYRSWQKIGSQKKATATELIEAVKNQIAYEHFRGHNGELFIPNPSTWLNQGRWKDEIKKTVTAQQYEVPGPYVPQYGDE